MKYAYIDESGTRDSQTVMTVSMVVVEGCRTAEKLHGKIMAELYPDYVRMRRRFRREKIHRPVQLHYVEMSIVQRNQVAVNLALANVAAYVVYYYHQSPPVPHETKFRIYTELVKDAIRLATTHHKELSVVVAQQGGWQGYEQGFIADLKALEYEQDRHGLSYRKLAISLSSAAHPGLQIADFYAGACRYFLLHPDNGIDVAHFWTIERQTRLELTSFGVVK